MGALSSEAVNKLFCWKVPFYERIELVVEHENVGVFFGQVGNTVLSAKPGLPAVSQVPGLPVGERKSKPPGAR